MTTDEFREMALSFPNAEERSHMGHPDFRVGGKIFATISPDADKAMVKLTPDEQQNYLRMQPAAFEPASGAWGTGGATMVILASADDEIVHDALRSAWRNTAPKKMLAEFDELR